MSSQQLSQKSMNIKSFVRSFNVNELQILTNHFMTQINIQISKSVKTISPKCYMITITMGPSKISGYGRNEEEAHLNAYKNFFEGIVDDENLYSSLILAISKMKESLSGERNERNNSKVKKPPKGKNDTSYLSSSLLNCSMEKNGYIEKIKAGGNGGELGKIAKFDGEGNEESSGELGGEKLKVKKNNFTGDDKGRGSLACMSVEDNGSKQSLGVGGSRNGGGVLQENRTAGNSQNQNGRLSVGTGKNCLTKTGVSPSPIKEAKISSSNANFSQTQGNSGKTPPSENTHKEVDNKIRRKYIRER
jgi:ribosome-associated translation inhibitor RaiA